MYSLWLRELIHLFPRDSHDVFGNSFFVTSANRAKVALPSKEMDIAQNDPSSNCDASSVTSTRLVA